MRAALMAAALSWTRWDQPSRARSRADARTQVGGGFFAGVVGTPARAGRKCSFAAYVQAMFGPVGDLGPLEIGFRLARTLL